MRISIYLLSIVLANVITARFAPLDLGLFIIPYGTLFIGLTLVMRDMVQNRFGRFNTYLLIVFALILSAISSYLLGDALWVVFASTLSFIVSETADTEIYTRFKLPFVRRVFYSGVVAGFLDSALFVIIGIGPLGLNFVPWELVPYAILGQWVAKVLMQLIVAGGIRQVVIKMNIYEPNISDVK
ncbi:VUT family protein [Sporosarcina pasteurii]|uniref:VUT family protein n=1 Tax=Sporosarcina pasteurii TaxID=1474 RepID=UPI000E1C2997|nr:VUT family protein [Sporosarcina pasteurii]MDS9471606.1 VUT family protein [Sporosarcina pasteurii]QBQ07042.1 VUT family protein [Sporosarcina pasteurii]